MKSAINGAISGFIVGAILIIPDWGNGDEIAKGFAAFIDGISTVATVKELKESNIGFIAGFAIGSIIMTMAGINKLINRLNNRKQIAIDFRKQSAAS